MIDPALQRSIEGLFRHGDRDDSRAELWDSLAARGFVHPFAHGATLWSEGAAILAMISRHAPGFALGENVAASFLLQRAGRQLPAQRLTLADPLCSELTLAADVVHGRMQHVPHAAVSSHVLSLAHHASSGEPYLVCIELRGAEGESAQNVAGEPRDSLIVKRAPAIVLHREPTANRSSLLLIGALLRATQVAAMGEALLDLVLDYAKTRTQFGRAIAEHQAVEQQLAELACDVALGSAAVRFAEGRLDLASSATHALGDDAVWRAVLQAKILSTRLAETAIRIGHGIVGALGFTEEHSLSRFTTRLMSYPAEFGAARMLAEQLGRAVVERGAQALWTDVVALSE